MIAVNLVANTDLKTADEFRNLVIRLQRSGAIVRSGRCRRTLFRHDPTRRCPVQRTKGATFIGVWPLPNANTLDVVRAVREALPEIQSRMPTGMKAGVAFDSTVYIETRSPTC